MQINEHVKDLRSRFVEYFLDYTASQASSTAQDYEALELEKDNLLYAIDLAFSSGDWTSVLKMRSALEGFLGVRGYWDDAVRTGQQALRSARELGTDVTVAQFAHNLGV